VESETNNSPQQERKGGKKEEKAIGNFSYSSPIVFFFCSVHGIDSLNEERTKPDTATL
jgi:hypothetical protein